MFPCNEARCSVYCWHILAIILGVAWGGHRGCSRAFDAQAHLSTGVFTVIVIVSSSLHC